MRAIGDLSRTTRCKVETIRYYERVGLMPEPARSPGGQRRYTQAHEQRLGFIRHARELGFSLEAIRQMLDLSDRPGQSCQEVDRLARRHLDEVTSRIRRLESLKQELERMISHCDGGEVSDCRILEVLADHSLCQASH